MVNRGNYVKPWTRQRMLQKEYIDEEVPDIDELSELLNAIKYGVIHPKKQTLRARALFAMYYLTACRVSEILNTRKKDILLREIDGRKCMLIRTLNKKHKTRKSKRLPIPIDKEYIIVMHVYNYVKYLREDTLLFDFKVKRATQIINDITGWNPHFIRHIRATHLIAKYDFNEQLLVRFMGWTDSRPAKHYMELKSKDVFRQFYR
jgi:integrase